MCATSKKTQTIKTGLQLTNDDKEEELAKIKAKKLRQKDYYYMRTYGISLKVYTLIKEQQNHQCKICDKTDCKLVVDHCHTTNIIRGLLCHNCNVALGHLRDKPEVIGKCIEYLQESRKYTVAGITVKFKEFSKDKIYKVESI